ncbi:DUF934 domain-containing protein [Nevskia ramosa]|uniref:DUF934 domain-containing protein n=1 Tax=Nevskia ramosa TaxID=64002 RepID=UPI0003B31DC1|nr:DUF934 domain-containing protein [Nevskia ramosa]
MSTLIRNLRIEADDYVLLADDVALPVSGKVIVSHARWLAERDALLASGLTIGIKLPNTVDIATVLPEIAERPLIELDFPSFPDGRAYSQARLLAERFRYKGELRATGKAVVRDQFQFLLRCGFTSFELRDGQDPAACLAAVHEFSVPYQQAADHAEPVFLRRRGDAA